jgi:hypothetical protein
MKKYLALLLLFAADYSYAQLTINEYTCYRKEVDNNGFHKDILLGNKFSVFPKDSLNPEQGCQIPFGTNPEVKCYTIISYSEEKYKIADNAPYKIGLYFFRDSLVMIEMEFQGIATMFQYASFYNAEDCIEKKTDYNEKIVEADFSIQGDRIYLNTSFRKLGAADKSGFTFVQIFDKKAMKRIAEYGRKNGY